MRQGKREDGRRFYCLGTKRASDISRQTQGKASPPQISHTSSCARASTRGREKRGKQPKVAPWELRAIECKEWLAQFNLIDVIHTPRETNQVADSLAKAQRKKTLPPNWMSNPPLDLWELLCSENHNLCCPFKI